MLASLRSFHCVAWTDCTSLWAARQRYSLKECLENVPQTSLKLVADLLLFSQNDVSLKLRFKKD